ncbi:TonB-dependent receptor domain-containing protein [Caulobacter sp. KR2-114]|uniref:TonB-dependent receptor domain-containing protein n=1 Tax=Caulobacter sp. KR2-114 TaxID=3400912 RepID=UPI003C115FE5
MAVGFVLAAAIAQASSEGGAAGAASPSGVSTPAQPASETGCAVAPGLRVAPQLKAGSTSSFAPACFAASAPTTALDMVNLLPGFVLDTGSSVRGFGGAAGNVLIDGARPATKGDPLDEILKRIPASQVLRIDVIRGGAPGIDMQGKTVIANVIRREDRGLKLTVQVAGSLVENGDVSGGLRIEGSKRVGETAFEGALLAASGLDDGVGDGPRTVRNAAGLIDHGQEYGHALAWNYKLTGAVETPVAGGRLKLDATVFLNPYDAHLRDAFVGPRGLELEHDHQDTDTYEVGARYERPITGKLSSETFLLQQFGVNNYDERLAGPTVDERFILDKSTRESILRSSLKYQATPTLNFEAGGEGAYNWLRSHTLYEEGGAPVPLPAANVMVTEARGEAFATATWRVRPNLTVETGIRAEASRIRSSGDVASSRSLFYPKPRVLVSWAPDAADQVRVRFEREVGQLNFDDFTASAASLGGGSVHGGNPNLNPQQDWVAEAAWDHRFWGAAQITLTGRHYWLRDVEDHVPDPTGSFDTPGNIGAGTKDELALNLNLPTDRLGLKHGVLTATGTWRHSSVRDPTTGQMREISGLHHYDSEIHFTQGLPRWKATWGFDIIGAWRETYYRFNEIDTDRLKTWVAFHIEYKPRPDWMLRLEFDNATARGFEHIREYFPGPRDLATDPVIDTRNLHYGRLVHIAVRKTFG